MQGFSTGLPERLQLALLHTLPGLEQCKMLRPAYGAAPSFFSLGELFLVFLLPSFPILRSRFPSTFLVLDPSFFSRGVRLPPGHPVFALPANKEAGQPFPRRPDQRNDGLRGGGSSGVGPFGTPSNAIVSLVTRSLTAPLPSCYTPPIRALSPASTLRALLGSRLPSRSPVRDPTCVCPL